MIVPSVQQKVNVLEIQAKTDLAPDKVQELVEKYYGYQVRKVQKVRAVYKLETDQGTVAFKNARKIKDIAFIHSVLHHLHTCGFAETPSLRKTKTNTLLLSYQNDDYVVEQWLPQKVKEVSVHADNWLFSAGKALAAFHHAISSYPFSYIPKKRIRRPWGIWFVQQYNKIKYHIPWDQSAEKYWLLDRMKRAKDQFRMYPAITTHLCHGSLHQENIMIDRDQKVWLIDYERITYDAIGKDIAQLLMYHFRFHSWNQAAVEQLLTGYEEVSPLSQADLHHICTRSLVPESIIYAYLDGKVMVTDWEQEMAKEAIWKRLVPSYWER
jgi:Ser/Thr protein kinase RdoA (MazF antagonist)